MPTFGKSSPALLCCDLDTGFAIVLDDDGQLWRVGVNSGQMTKVEVMEPPSSAKVPPSSLARAVDHLIDQEHHPV